MEEKRRETREIETKNDGRNKRRDRWRQSRTERRTAAVRIKRYADLSPSLFDRSQTFRGSLHKLPQSDNITPQGKKEECFMYTNCCKRIYNLWPRAPGLLASSTAVQSWVHIIYNRHSPQFKNGGAQSTLKSSSSTKFLSSATASIPA